MTNLDFRSARVDQRHFGQYDLKWHFECFDARAGCAISIQMLLQPHGRKLIFFDLSRSSMQIKGKQNTVSTT